MFNKIFSKSRLKLLSVLLLVGVFNLSILAAVLPSIVSAGPFLDPPGISRFSEDFYTKHTVQQEAAIWSSVQLIKSGACGNLFPVSMNGTVTSADIVAGKWYLNVGSRSMGHHVDPGDGRLNCDNENSWFSDLLNAAGYGGGRYTVLADKVKSSANTKQALLDELSMSFFGRTDAFRFDPPAYLTYHILLRNFTSSACSAKVLTTPDQAVGKTKVTIQIFDGSTNAVNPVDYVYTADPGSNPPGKAVGHGLPGDGGNDGEMQCRSMASQLQNAAYANDMLAYVTLTGDTTGSTPAGTGDVEPSCEDKGVLNWIMCPFMTMMDGLISFLDGQIQERLIIDSSVYNNDQIKQIWSVMRNIAFMLLVPIMLVMVIGTALEFGPFDAYTVKKALPRMFVAVIFIALSLPICQFFIELSNIAGTGILGLMTAPFENAPISLQSLYGPAGAGAIGGTTLIAAGGLFYGLATGGVAIGIIASFALVTLLAFLIAYLVLLLRELVLISLIIIAPLAILVWIFPGNDKPWKLWKGAFTNLLIMFPLIMGLIAGGRILAEVIDTTQGDTAAFFLKLTAFIAPYFFIPATFKVAGGLFATVAGIANDKGRGIFDRQKKYRQGGYAKANERVGRRVVAKRADWQNQLQTQGSNQNKSALGRLAARTAARGVGGYNVQALASARQASVGKEVNDQIATGRDEEVRGLTVNKQWALDKGKKDVDWQLNKDGVREFKSLGGAWVSEGAVDAGHRRWGNDAFAQQAALSYEMRKASSEEEVQGIGDNYATVAKSWGMSDNQAGGAWIGSAFENQNQHLEYKSTDWRTGALSTNASNGLMGEKLVNEVYEKRGSYNLAQMGSNTIEQFKTAYSSADAVSRSANLVLSGKDAAGNLHTYSAAETIDAGKRSLAAEDQKQKIAAVAETFMHEAGYAGGTVGQPDDGQPVNVPGASRRQANTPGAAHTAERVRELAELAGVGPSGSGPTGPYSDPNHAPTPNRREQS